MVLRVAKVDAVYLYQLLESYEGLVNYSTLPAEKGCGYRDIYVTTTSDLQRDWDEVLQKLRAEVELQILPDPPAVKAD